MKQYLILSVLVLSTINIVAQSYNDYISDNEINQFMVEVLTTQVHYGSAFNRINKNIYHKPIHLGEADWSFVDLNDKYNFDIRFKKLNSRSDLNNSDINFMKNQFETIKDSKWTFHHSKLKFKKKYRKNYFKYSIPIFNKDKTLAIMWRYQYCGSLCAYSELHIYKLKDGKWVMKELIDGYIS